MGFPLIFTGLAMAASQPADMPLDTLQGTWRMESAYELHPDGSVTRNYGEQPLGLMMVDPQGNYSIQIFRPGRRRFASGDKLKGDAAEYREAVVGSSTHFGRVKLVPDRHELVFSIEAASFPNWEGKVQTRVYTYRDGRLDYAVPASAAADGTVAHSIWRRVK